jgi:hypothetical protein
MYLSVGLSFTYKTLVLIFYIICLIMLLCYVCIYVCPYVMSYIYIVRLWECNPVVSNIVMKWFQVGHDNL